MILKPDIITKIENDFCENSTKAFDVLEKAIQKTDYLENDRIIRCIIFLSEGNLTELNKYIEIATFDPRDVMLWAEYEKGSDLENFKRLRDFSKTFEECAIGINE